MNLLKSAIAVMAFTAATMASANEYPVTFPIDNFNAFQDTIKERMDIIITGIRIHATYDCKLDNSDFLKINQIKISDHFSGNTVETNLKVKKNSSSTFRIISGSGGAARVVVSVTNERKKEMNFKLTCVMKYHETDKKINPAYQSEDNVMDNVNGFYTEWGTLFGENTFIEHEINPFKWSHRVNKALEEIPAADADSHLVEKKLEELLALYKEKGVNTLERFKYYEVDVSEVITLRNKLENIINNLTQRL